MFVDIERGMDEYIDTTDEITLALREENGPILQAVRAFDDYFRTTLWRDTGALAPLPLMLSMNAYMLFLAGVRVAMTGHATAAFPVLRTALESACYGYLIAKKPDLGEVWSNRHKGEAAKKASRRAFGSAVADVAKDVERQQPGGGQWLAEAYDLAIDFGGHPNIKSVLGHIRLGEDDPDDPFFRVNLAGLYGADHWETRRMLFGCLDFAMAIAVVLTRALDAPDREHQDQLQALNDRKNQVAEDFEEGRLDGPDRQAV
jgi:hypothetical protein